MPPAPASDPVPPYLLLIMTAMTGIVDAVSVLGLGHIFTANMTGNVVFLGFAVAGAPGFSAARSCAAVIAFLFGAVAGGRMANKMATLPANQWVGRAFCVDGLLLLGAALTSLPLQLANETNSVTLFEVICLTALAMGFRNATVRRLGMADLTTTVLTLGITGLAADSSLAGGTNPRWGRRIGSILTMFLGAILGVFLLKNSCALALGVCGMTSLACAVAILSGIGRAKSAIPGPKLPAGTSDPL